MNIKKLRSEYTNRHPLLERLKDTAHSILNREIQRKKVPIHSLEGRIKSFPSVLEKIQRKGIKDKNPFRKIHDLLGIRIVCLFRSDIKKIKNIIGEIFEVINEKNRINEILPDIFGYRSLHFTVRLKRSSYNSYYERMRKIPFEVQLRTIADDAWASVSHHLYYKQEDILPADLKRDFHALSGLFYIADTHFEMLRAKQIKRLTNTRFVKD